MGQLLIVSKFALETALQKIRNENTGAYLGNQKLNILAYADNIVLLGHREHDVRLFSVFL